MKKKIFGAVVVVAIAVGAMINVNLNKVSNKGDLALANVEALAQAETDYCNTVYKVYIRPDGTGYNCTSGGSESCCGRK
jgi:hypothetical protein